jgi:hypothetical protein
VIPFVSVAEGVVIEMISTTALVSAREPVASTEVTLADMSTAMMPAGKMMSAKVATPEVSTAMAPAEVSTAMAPAEVTTSVSPSMTAAAMTATAVTTAPTLAP